MLLHGKDEVFATAGLELAHRGEQRADELLVATDTEDHQPAKGERRTTPEPAKVVHGATELGGYDWAICRVSGLPVSPASGATPSPSPASVRDPVAGS